MKSQEKKEYLKRYQEASARVTYLSEEMCRIRSEACKISPVLSDMPSGRSCVNSKIEQAVERLDACAAELEQEVRAMEQAMSEIRAAIVSVPDETLRQLLELRYINGLKWWEIAERLSYSDEAKNVYKLHGKALHLLKLDTELHHKPVI